MPMTKLTRRSFGKFLAALPIVGPLAAKAVASDAPPEKVIFPWREFIKGADSSEVTQRAFFDQQSFEFAGWYVTATANRGAVAETKEWFVVEGKVYCTASSRIEFIMSKRRPPPVYQNPLPSKPPSIE